MAKVRGNRTLRVLDRYLGIPLVAAFGARPRRARPDLSRVHRIGVMKSVAIGDMVLLAGVIGDVRSSFPNVAIVIISGEDNADVADLIARPGDERVVVSPNEPFSSVRQLRRARLDVLLDFGAWPRFDAVLSALSGARYTIGFATAGQGRHFAYDETVEYSSEAHEIDNDRRLAATIGVASKSVPRIGPVDDVGGAALPRKPYVVFQPWAGGFRHALREWPGKSWLELARFAASRGWAILICGAPADAARSREMHGALTAAGIEAVDAAGHFSLRELTRVLAEAEVVVSVNTGIMHLAAAVGARVVGLQGPTSSRRWGPLGEHARAVDSRLAGCGYLNLGWEYDGHRLDCMSGVAVADVITAIESLRR